LNNLTLGVLITLAQWMTPAPIYSRGGAVWYAPGVMEANCQYRGYDMDRFEDGVAMMSPSDLGKTVWLRPLGQDWQGPFIVCDCGVRGQVYEMVTVRGEVVEVGWSTAERWGMGPFDGGWKTEVEVFVGDKEPSVGLDFVEPIDYVDWFIKLVEEK